MSRSVSGRQGRGQKSLAFVSKPRGVIQPRVEAVGPARFGVVVVDCAKARSKWMLCDFFGKVLSPPQEVEHTQAALRLAVTQVRHCLAEHDLQDQIVVIERTGQYHTPVQQAFRQAGWETRLVHPLASKHYRQTADPQNKTDDNDLNGIFRAAVNGFGLLDEPLTGAYAALRLLARHRRDLVQKRSAVECQLREHLELALPGYAALFDDLWDHGYALWLARQLGTAEAFAQQGVAGLGQLLRNDRRRFQEKVLERLFAWSRQTLAPAPDIELRRMLWQALDDDRLAKTKEIGELERQLAGWLVQTPYVLLLSLAGINVVSAAELAGEMGPIARYASARAITGRAGIFPARYQSDRVDVSGRLVKHGQRPLRAVLLYIADNLILCNPLFRGQAALWQKLERNPGWIRVRCASKFSRVLFQLVRGQQVFSHPACRERDYVVKKLLQFHLAHETPLAQTLRDLQGAVSQIPAPEHAAEAAPLAEQLATATRAHRPGVKPLTELLPIVLARLGVGDVQSTAFETRGSSRP